ncbi:uncharacterized protein PAC_06163 [Phialocephala subalpina]|uniref:Uncharacterized protein n=1 Tax=Phialocephala subalpina TaxID=576137 RepID=A0A1L7WU25_9HELO|nr:uncharacterized protein PAC_06163 [Phialocephala subalpina]
MTLWILAFGTTRDGRIDWERRSTPSAECLSIQRRIWSFALPRGPTIIEALLTNDPERLNPSAPADKFLCTNPYAAVLEVCGKRNDPTYHIRPVHLTKRPSSGRPQRETMYIHPDLWSLDGLSFVLNGDNQLKVASIIMGMASLDTLYAVEGDTLSSGLGASRVFCAEIWFTEVPQGPPDFQQGTPWTSRCAKEAEQKYCFVVNDMEVQGPYRRNPVPPNLICRRVERFLLDVRCIPGFSRKLSPPGDISLPSMGPRRIEHSSR